MLKVGDIINVDGYAVEVAGFNEKPGQFKVNIHDGKVCLSLGDGYNEETIAEEIYSTVLPMIIYYNGSRDLPKFSYEDDSTITVLGKPYTFHWVTVDEDVDECAYTLRGNDTLYVLMHKPSVALAKDLFTEYLETVAQGYALQRHTYFAQQMGLPRKTITFAHMDDAWGTCTLPLRDLTFNWLLLTQERDFIDEVIVHELAHYTYPAHDLDFFLLMAKYVPNFQENTPAVIKRNLPRWK